MVWWCSDLTDLEGVSRPNDIKYMKLLRTSLTVLHSYPHKEIKDPEPNFDFLGRLYIYGLKVCLLVPGFLYLRNNITTLSFFEFGHTFITVFMNVVAISRLSMTFWDKYKYFMSDWVNEIHLFHYQHKSEYSQKTYILVHKMCHLLTTVTITQLTIGVTTFNLVPMYHNFASGAYKEDKPEGYKYEHSVYYALPFDYQTNFNGYLVLLTFNWYISAICSGCLCIYDLLVSLIVFHVWGHMRILVYTLEHFPVPQDNGPGKMFTPEEIEKADMQLREIIAYHREIMKFTKRLMDVFGPELLVYQAFHQIGGCVLLLEISQLDLNAVVRFGTLAFYVHQQLVQISVIFELLGSMNEQMPDAVYSVPWECMDNRRRRVVYLFLMKVQRQVNLRAVGMLQIGVKTMATILKTSISYFMLLRTLASK